jgi:hypothetical protein
MKGVIYTRVSSAEQLREGFSIPAQRAPLRDYAERQRIEVAVEFTDDETAKASGRTGFARMLAHLAAHPVHEILVEKLDRLYRNEDDCFTLKKMGVVIHFVREGNVIGVGVAREADATHQARHRAELLRQSQRGSEEGNAAEVRGGRLADMGAARLSER